MLYKNKSGKKALIPLKDCNYTIIDTFDICISTTTQLYNAKTKNIIYLYFCI